MVKIRKETTGQTMIYKTLHRKPMLRQHAQKTNAWATRTENQWLGKTHRKPMLGQHELHRKNEDELLLHSACLKSQQITKYSSLLQKS